MSAAATFATLIHLKTGHVLAAASVVGAEPKLEDLTAGDHLPVRFPGTSDIIDVPILALTATRVALSADTASVLDRPQYYVLGGDLKLSAPEPPMVDSKPKNVTAGEKYVVVWRVGDESFVQDGELEDAKPPAPPTEAKYQLFVYESSPLYLDHLPL
jgi:hypothetical protein